MCFFKATPVGTYKPGQSYTPFDPRVATLNEKNRGTVPFAELDEDPMEGAVSADFPASCFPCFLLNQIFNLF